MNRSAAFTLLEVLFAVVLLALVVAVCIPYLGQAACSYSTSEITEFATQIDEQVNRFKLSHASEPSIEDLSDLLSPLGLLITAASDPDTELHGQWVSITNGEHTILRWAYTESESWEVLP